MSTTGLRVGRRTTVGGILGCVIALVITACGGSGDEAQAPPSADSPAIGAELRIDSTDAGPGSLVSATEMPLLDRRVTAAASISARVEYRSTSGITDKPTTVTGSIFVPLGTPPSGGWPLVALGHGTTGVLGECGPSLDPTLLGVTTLASGLLRLGYAVTVTDYEGLGTPGSTEPTHPYLDATTEGMNVIDSVRAARRLSKSVSARWAALGTSQGGQAVWSANELAGTYSPELNLLGTASVSPAADIAPLAQAAQDKKLTEDQYGALQWLLLALKRENPDLDLDLYRRGVVETQWKALSQCSPEFAAARTAAVRAIAPDDLVPSTPEATATLTNLLAARSLPKAKASAPMLVLYGGKDQLVTPAWTTAALARACRRGDDVQFQLDPDKGHDDVDTAPALGWLANRFNGAPIGSSCGAAAS
ncbi:lipase family protein [Williamsia maris]|uniref:Secretory lipase n=1 Tax=Williamsia maris TaxID=72806 RepID=A0ABT1HFQ6_9NOCA|nr:lipase family protein [Williamsia maris]MCP2177082.1 Secretory lipase [Williamsia maris]